MKHFLAIIALSAALTIPAAAQSLKSQPPAAIPAACTDCITLTRAAAAAAYGETVLATERAITGNGYLEFRIADVGGASKLMVSVFNTDSSTRNLRVNAWFGPTGAPYITGANRNVTGGSSEILWNNVITAGFDVHGSVAGLRVYNDSLFSVTVTQITAYWVK